MRKLFFFLSILLIVCMLSPLNAQASRIEEDSSYSTEAVDNSVSLADGSYEPDAFSFTGGTGKVKITCPEILVENGQAFARILFSSSSYSYVKASGIICYAETVGKQAQFLIPVALNRNNQLLALTTKMSTPHEIEYTIFVQLNGDGAAEATDSLDVTAPELPGFSFLEEIPMEGMKLFRYDNVLLFEMETGICSAAEEIPEEDMTPADYTAALYHKDVYKYLVAAENAELPAGIEKQYIVLQLPLSGICAVSEDAQQLLDQRQIPWLPFPGTPDQPDYRTMLLSQVKLILGGDTLPYLHGKLADRLATLRIAAIPGILTEQDLDTLLTLLFEVNS